MTDSLSFDERILTSQKVREFTKLTKFRDVFGHYCTSLPIGKWLPSIERLRSPFTQLRLTRPFRIDSDASLNVAETAYSLVRDMKVLPSRVSRVFFVPGDVSEHLLTRCDDKCLYTPVSEVWRASGYDLVVATGENADYILDLSGVGGYTPSRFDPSYSDLPLSMITEVRVVNTSFQLLSRFGILSVRRTFEDVTQIVAPEVTNIVLVYDYDGTPNCQFGMVTESSDDGSHSKRVVIFREIGANSRSLVEDVAPPLKLLFKGMVFDSSVYRHGHT